MGFFLRNYINEAIFLLIIQLIGQLIVFYEINFSKGASQGPPCDRAHAPCGQPEPAAGASPENPARGVSRRHVDEPVCGDHPDRKPANQRRREVNTSTAALNDLASARTRALRLRRGLTQKQAAGLAGVSLNQYRKIEAGGRRNIRLATVGKLARAFGLEAWQLIHCR